MDPDQKALFSEVAETMLSLIKECESYHIDWARLNSNSPDHDPTYKPEFPPVVEKAKRVLANFQMELEDL